MILALQNQLYTSIKYGAREIIVKNKFCGFLSFKLSGIINIYKIYYLKIIIFLVTIF